VKSIERVADHAASIADKSLKITTRISQGLFQQIDKMSNMSLALLANAVDALLKRDYDLADSLVDKVDAIRFIENEIILSVDKERNTKETNHKPNIANIKLILEDIRRTAEYATDISEAAMNQTISQVIEKQGFEDK
jgi:phosphate uptake regulator